MGQQNTKTNLCPSFQWYINDTEYLFYVSHQPFPGFNDGVFACFTNAMFDVHEHLKRHMEYYCILPPGDQTVKYKFSLEQNMETKTGKISQKGNKKICRSGVKSGSVGR